LSLYLLDTNVVLFALTNDPRLTADIRALVAAGSNCLSVVSYWEVIVKSMKGKLYVGDPRIWWDRALKELSAVELNIERSHVERVFHLPPFHQDPFDRILIAQATAENLTLLTTDSEVASYASQGYRVIV
jgi:PIN domain nuclease of toxin-antitoxin system